jgi:hypothetical protein
MKKHILMIAAVCLLVLPTKANDLAEQLCADEVFVAMIQESENVSKHMLSLNDSQREEYLRSEEFACFRENLLQNKEYLSTTYNLFERADSKVVIIQAIKKVVKQKDAAWCQMMYNYYFMSCFSIINPFDQAQCFAAAQAWYNQCLAEVGGVE